MYRMVFTSGVVREFSCWETVLARFPYPVYYLAQSTEIDNLTYVHTRTGLVGCLYHYEQPVP